MSDDVGMSYQKDDVKQSFPSFVSQCIDLFKQRYGYMPQLIAISSIEPDDSKTVYGIPVVRSSLTLPNNCILYPVVRRRRPIRSSEKFPV